MHFNFERTVNKTHSQGIDSHRQWWINWHFHRLNRQSSVCLLLWRRYCPCTCIMKSADNSLDLHLPQPKCTAPFFSLPLLFLHLSICLLPHHFLPLSLFTKSCPKLPLTSRARVKTLPSRLSQLRLFTILLLIWTSSYNKTLKMRARYHLTGLKLASRLQENKLLFAEKI